MHGQDCIENRLLISEDTITKDTIAPTPLAKTIDWRDIQPTEDWNRCINGLFIVNCDIEGFDVAFNYLCLEDQYEHLKGNFDQVFVGSEDLDSGRRRRTTEQGWQCQLGIVGLLWFYPVWYIIFLR